MFYGLGRKKAQTTLEYAILIGVIVASLIAMQTYVRRGFQGKLRDNADNMGEQFSPGATAVHNVRNSPLTNTREEQFANGESKTEWLTDLQQVREQGSYEQVNQLADEEWNLNGLR